MSSHEEEELREFLDFKDGGVFLDDAELVASEGGPEHAVVGRAEFRTPAVDARDDATRGLFGEFEIEPSHELLQVFHGGGHFAFFSEAAHVNDVDIDELMAQIGVVGIDHRRQFNDQRF